MRYTFYIPWGFLILLLSSPQDIISQSPSPEMPLLAIKCGQLIDGKSDAALSNAVIIIDRDRIARVGVDVAPAPANLS